MKLVSKTSQKRERIFNLMLIEKNMAEKQLDLR